MSHNHSHGCGHEHSHDDDAHVDPNEGARDFLFSKIDRDAVVALNAVDAASGSKLIKPWDRRLDETEYCESDADDQLIVRVPFTGQVKLRAIIIKPAPGELCPTAMRVYANAQLDFDDAETAKPTIDEIAIVEPVGMSGREPVEYAVRASKFPAVRSVTLFFPSSRGGDATRLYFIGFKGEFSELRDEPVSFSYELSANPADHAKIRGTDGGLSQPGA